MNTYCNDKTFDLDKTDFLNVHLNSYLNTIDLLCKKQVVNITIRE